MICPNCKKELNHTVSFCNYCGARIAMSKKDMLLSIIVVVVVVTFIVVTTIAVGSDSKWANVYCTLLMGFLKIMTFGLMK